MTVFLLALAGGAGAALRYVIEHAMTHRFGSALPWGLFVVNGTGSLALGLLLGLAPEHDVVLVLGVGLLGGYTTLSGASLATARLSLRRDLSGILISSVGMLTLCVLGAAVGWAVT